MSGLIITFSTMLIIIIALTFKCLLSQELPSQLTKFKKCCKDNYKELPSVCYCKGAFKIDKQFVLVTEIKGSDRWGDPTYYYKSLRFDLDNNGLPNLDKAIAEEVSLPEGEILADAFNYKDKVYFITSEDQMFKTKIYSNTKNIEETEKLAIHKNVPQGMVPYNTIHFNKAGIEQTLVAYGKMNPNSIALENIQKVSDSGAKETETDGKPFKTSASVIIGEEQKNYLYYTFQERNWTCLIRRPFDSQEVQYDYPIKDVNRRPQCFRIETFFGCPQSFCYNHEVDDFLTQKTSEVYIFRGYYYWTLMDGKLPLGLPTMVEAMAFQKLIGSEDLKSGNLDAAEAFDSAMMFIKGDLVVTKKGEEVQSSSAAEMFAGRVDWKKIDAAWFNPTSKELTLFGEDKVMKYKVTQDLKFEPLGEEAYLLKEFPGIKTPIEAVYQPSAEPSKTCFLSDKWYYFKGPSDESYKTMYSWDPENALFDFYSGPVCHHSNKKAAQDDYEQNIKPLLDEYFKQRILPEPPSGDTNSSNDGEDSSKEEQRQESKSSFATVIIAVFAVIVFVVIIVGAVIGGVFATTKKKEKKVDSLTELKTNTKPDTLPKEATGKSKSEKQDSSMKKVDSSLTEKKSSSSGIDSKFDSAVSLSSSKNISSVQTIHSSTGISSVVPKSSSTSGMEGKSAKQSSESNSGEEGLKSRSPKPKSVLKINDGPKEKPKPKDNSGPKLSGSRNVSSVQTIHSSKSRGSVVPKSKSASRMEVKSVKQSTESNSVKESVT